MKKVLIGLMALGIASSPALAADPIVYPTTSPVVTSSTFDWDRFYLGLSVGSMNDGAQYFGFGGLAGLNMQSGDWVFGLEVQGSAYYDGGTYTGALYDVFGRAGYLVAPEALLYASGGVVFNGTGDTFAGIGGGIEFAVHDDVTFGGEYTYITDGGGATGHVFDAKLRWYFN
ncbi:outer membrane protein [Maritalea sp. S77]|jgi:outer membrane immunogenic protein|uniref:outer membrane protein n=1 Tax=Maritalea sp. S77 TaxID=3415125 RepID=UPI003C7C20F4